MTKTWADDDEARDDADDQEMHADAGGVLQTELIRAGCPDGINFPDAIWLGSNNPIAPHVSTHSQSPHLSKKTPNPHVSHSPISFLLFVERRSSSSLIVRLVAAGCLPLHRGLHQRSPCFLSTPCCFAPSPTESDE